MRFKITLRFKLLISVVTVLSLVGITAAAAKSTHKRVHARAPAWSHAPAWSADSPEAKYPPSDPYAVWVAGTYVGRDPDPRVRDSLIREFYHNLDNR